MVVNEMIEYQNYKRMAFLISAFPFLFVNVVCVTSLHAAYKHLEKSTFVQFLAEDLDNGEYRNHTADARNHRRSTCT